MAILTVSREFGSGGREIGKAVSDALGYEYIDKKTILSEAREAGEKWERWGKELDEHCPTIWEKYDWSFKGFGALVQSSILNHALGGKTVIMGQGGNFLLADIPHALRVRIVAPMEKRVERIMIRESVDAETARWLAKKTDSERECFIRAIYGKHWDDKSKYDMVIDTGLKPEQEIVELLKATLIEKDKLSDEKACHRLKMLVAAAKVRAGILTNPKFLIPTLDVYYDGEAIMIKGVIHSPKEHTSVEEEAKRLSKGVPVKCELHYRR